MSNPLAIVTGASRGIGRTIAIKLAELGYDLIVNYVGNQTMAQETAIECQALAMSQDRHHRADGVQGDISDARSRQRRSLRGARADAGVGRHEHQPAHREPHRAVQLPVLTTLARMPSRAG